MAEKRSGKEHRSGAAAAQAKTASVATAAPAEATGAATPEAASGAAESGAAGATEAAVPGAAEVEALMQAQAARIAELESQVAATTREAEEYLDRLQRLAADFENYKRRAQREKEELALYGAEKFIKTVLPVLDNLERALAATGGEQSLRTGVELTARQLREALTGAGVQPIPAEGEMFDPNLHMAVAVDAESEAAEDTIVAELQRGYKMGDRVLRPSMVRVAKK